MTGVPPPPRSPAEARATPGSPTRPATLITGRALAHIRAVWGTAGPYRAIPVAELAEAAAVSPAHLARMFRTQYGSGPAAALERLRLVRAATLLRHGTDPLATVGRWCGFADQYHFSHRFSTICGVPPGVYRRDPTTTRFRDPLSESGLAALGPAVLPTGLIEQLEPTAPPPPLPPGRRYAQTFTVPPAMVINRVCLYLATWFSADSAATVRLIRLDPEPTLVASRRLTDMVDHAAEWLIFAPQGSGRYRLELSEAFGTPTWKWHQGADVAPVGGSAEIDGVEIGTTNFLFTATVAG